MFVLSLILILLAEQEKVAGVRSPERPVVPNITALSSTEVRITWCRVHSNKVEIDHYELYIDTELEYSGIDVMYIAKRLKPWSWYEVKLRACGFSPGSCSPFSRPALVKTLRDGDNTTTVIQSGVTIFKAIVVPTYMFILGMIAGVLAISFVFTWRYLQCADLSGGSAFELPQYITSANKEEYSALITEQPSSFGKTFLSSSENTLCLTKASQVSDIESHYLELVPNKAENLSQQNGLVFADFISPSLHSVNSACDEKQGLLVKNQVPLQMLSAQLDTTHMTHTQVESLEGSAPFLKDYGDREHQQGMQSGTDKDFVQLRERTKCLSNSTASDNNLRTPLSSTLTEQVTANLDKANKCNDLSHSSSIMSSQTSDIQSQFAADQEVSTDLGSHTSPTSHERLVVAIDNSNIYIGAQECASMVNAGDRKRHVRVKLQNLVKILEKERAKTRGFAGGSSPPATEHVWEVYRRLGYIVDLEDRRGKDEQRVDESLQLWIYKALCELPPGVLVLATGDGTKGKSECDTSFPGCAVTALERGWSVEVCSWKHSLSSEWMKLAKKHHDKLTINYLDKYVNYITFVDGKNGRKCSPPPSEASVLQR